MIWKLPLKNSEGISQKRGFSLTAVYATKSPSQLYLDVAIKMAIKAGSLISQRLEQHKKISIKTSKLDLVTDTDIEIDAMLTNTIREKFPDHKIISEENISSNKGKVDLTESPTWIMDPIDGTLNFIHSFPHCCVSIGLFMGKEPYVGVAYNPVLNQLYTARKGHGAYLNGCPMKVSPETRLSASFVLVGTGWGNMEKYNVLTENFKKLIPIVHGIRNLGSSVLNMCCVARGGCEAYYCFGLHIWDLAAGELLITEAGGTVIDPSGKPVDRLSRRVLCAGTKELATTLSSILLQYYPKRDDEYQ